MRKTLVLSVFILLLIGISSGYFHAFRQGQFSQPQTTEQENKDDALHKNSLQFLSEDLQILTVAGEKPSFSIRLYSAFRLLVVTIAFKEICFKQFFKNKLTTSEITSNICLVKRLYVGYYTYGQGKIRI